jgi:hypothetical protein
MFAYDSKRIGVFLAEKKSRATNGHFMSTNILLRQFSFPDLCPITAAVTELSNMGDVEQRGAFYTRREVVEFILDLAGYTADRPLYRMKLLEPSFGNGDFLFVAVDRLFQSWKSNGDVNRPLEELGECLSAIELHRETFDQTRSALLSHLSAHKIAPDIAEKLAERWLIHADFLLAPLPESFDVVIGNPPYVRQEVVPDVLMAEYRSRYATIYDRADLYIPFIERSLHLLSPQGVLSFICSDRWMKNRYGGPLRALVANEFHLSVHVDMTGCDAFSTDVTAYPAVTVITRERNGVTRLAHRPQINSKHLSELAEQLRATTLPEAPTAVRELAGIAEGSEPWILNSDDQIAAVRRLERDFPAIEESGCRIGIGVATGADQAFIGSYDELDVEDDRKQRLVMTRDLVEGRVQWRGMGVINPFADDGKLVRLGDYPRLKRYLEDRKEVIASRHCAKKAPHKWYRTIDRITPSLSRQPKLLIPDIKGQAHVVYEEGQLYPHHNLYFVTSDEWDLRALQAVLLSDVARLFVATYSTRMRGGFLRFQAQYLRRIRLPGWEDVSPRMRESLISAATALDVAACNEATFELYNLSRQERAALGGAA